MLFLLSLLPLLASPALGVNSSVGLEPQSCRPSVAFTSPESGSVLVDVTTAELTFAVQCAAFPGDVLVRFLDPTSGTTPEGVLLSEQVPLRLSNLHVGSQIFVLLLHPVANVSVVLGRAEVSFEVVPPGVPAVDPTFVQRTVEAVAPATLSLPPLRVILLGDTAVYDGMKSFFVDYIRALGRSGASVTYLDCTCTLPNTDSAAVEGYTDSTVTGAAVLAAGARLVRWCFSCPEAVCHGDSSVAADAFAYTGALHQARTWEELPREWATLFEPLVPLFRAHDVMMLAWHDSFNEDPSRPGRLFLSHVALLANPTIVRLCDIGPTSDSVAPHAVVADVFTAPSHFVAATRLRAVPVDTLVMHPLLDVDAFDPDRAHNRSYCEARLRKGDADRVVAYVARLVSSKSPGMFIRAAALLAAHVPHVKFVMVGGSSGGYGAALYQLAMSLGLTPDNFAMLGFVPREELPAFYSCVDVMLFPSSTPFETFGIVNIEAMAMRVPLVHFGTAGMQDYVIPGVNSVLVPRWSPAAVHDAVLPLLTNDSLRAELGANGRQFVVNHLSDRVTAPHVLAALVRMVNAARLESFVTLVPTARAVEAVDPTGARAYLVNISVAYALSQPVQAVLGALLPEPMLPVYSGEDDAATAAYCGDLFGSRQRSSQLCFDVSGLQSVCAPWTEPAPTALLLLPPGNYTVRVRVTRHTRVPPVFLAELPLVLL